MSRRACCCEGWEPPVEGQELCTCASNTSGLVTANCTCNSVSCSGGGTGSSCCSATFSIVASMDGMLFADSYGGPWDEGDFVGISATTYAETLLGSCLTPCAGSCPVGPTDAVAAFNCKDIGANTAMKFLAVPSLCSGLAGVAWPFHLYYQPVACSSGVPSCYCAATMGYLKPLRYYSSFSAVLRWLKTAGIIRPMPCELSLLHSANLEKVSSVSDSGMNLSNISYRCFFDTSDGVAYFEVRIAWWPNWDRERLLTCSGCSPSVVSDTVAGSSGFGLTVLYRLPVSASISQHPCGVGIGTYYPHAILSAGFHEKSLGAFSALVVS